MSTMEDPPLTQNMFHRFAQLLHKQTGIHLAEHKNYLVEGRLSHFVGKGKRFSSYEALERDLEAGESQDLVEEFINAMTTNFSYFFRDSIHFDTLAWYIRERGPDSRSMRFWSAASSTGEEAYSMAITLMRHRDCLPADSRILATDISTKVLAKAEEGRYASSQIVPYTTPEIVSRWFHAEPEDRLRVKDEVKNLVSFRYWNLRESFPISKPLDVVFLRNVLIYFDNAVTEDVVCRIEKVMRPGGLLFLGLSESLVSVRHPFKMLRNSIYQKTRRE